FNGTNMRFAKAGITRIVISGGRGDDFLSNGVLDIPAKIGGGDGDDVLSGGLGNDSLNGGAGDDRLYGQPGDDVLDGGLGDDIMIGGDGTNTLSYASHNSGVTADLASGTGGNAKEHDTFSDIQNLVGGHGDDQLFGDDNSNIIRGGDGNDSITG